MARESTRDRDLRISRVSINDEVPVRRQRVETDGRRGALPRSAGQMIVEKLPDRHFVLRRHVIASLLRSWDLRSTVVLGNLQAARVDHRDAVEVPLWGLSHED